MDSGVPTWRPGQGGGGAVCALEKYSDYFEGKSGLETTILHCCLFLRNVQETRDKLVHDWHMVRVLWSMYLQKFIIIVLPAPKYMPQLRTFLTVARPENYFFALIGMTCGD